MTKTDDRIRGHGQCCNWRLARRKKRKPLKRWDGKRYVSRAGLPITLGLQRKPDERGEAASLLSNNFHTFSATTSASQVGSHTTWQYSVCSKLNALQTGAAKC
jgi:hypothetical protein